MCKLLCYVFCCCCANPSESSNASIGKDHKKKTKNKKKLKDSGSAKYGTDWETSINRVKNMSPSEIEDSLVTKTIEINDNDYRTRFEWYRAIVNSCGFDFIGDTPIGMGGFGEVYKIKDKRTNIIRALKVMRLRTGTDSFSASRFVAFKCEIFALRKTSHKNVIQLLDHFMVKETLCFIILEFASGGDLRDRLKAKYDKTSKAFDERETKTYFTQIANAMNFVHEKGIIHGDLKLENVLITQDSSGKEVIKVTDFGCSRVAFRDDQGFILREKAGGTLDCMAPEQIRVFICVNLGKPKLIGKTVVSYNPFRSDIWQLGVCLYRMLYYNHPFPFEKSNVEMSLVKMLKVMKKGVKIPKEPVVSLNCIDILKNLLEYNKMKRIDMEIVMHHKWVADCPELDKIKKPIIN